MTELPVESILVKGRVRASVADVADLVESISRIGLLHPVVVDDGGRLVAGERRLAAVREIGWRTVPVTVVSSLDDALRAQAESDENVCRRPFSPAEAVRMVERLKPFYEAEADTRKGGRGKKAEETGGDSPPVKAAERKSRTKAAKATGKSTNTIAKTKAVLDAAVNPDLPEAVHQRAVELAQELELPDANVNKATKELQKAIKAADRAEHVQTVGEYPPDLRRGDFREVLADLQDVDAIVTDPPYPAEYLPLLSDLSAIASKVLRPGGLCAVMIGQSYLPEVYARLSEYLDYRWTMAYLTPGAQSAQIWQQHVNTFWKPVLIFGRGAYEGPWYGDVAKSAVNDNDKDHHDWGQSVSGMTDIIDRLTQPGQTILDPFLGAGTTGVAATLAGRRFIGCDIDANHVATARARLA